MFSGFVVTNAGAALLAKAMAGQTIEFTRVQIGSGALEDGVEATSLTALVAPSKYLPITSMRREGAMVSVAFLISNIGTTGFTFSEAGLFANDPDDGEILYAYTNAGADPEVLPDPSVTTIEYVMSFDATVSSEANVSVVIDESFAYITANQMAEAFENHKEDEHGHNEATIVSAGFMSASDKERVINSVQTTGGIMSGHLRFKASQGIRFLENGSTSTYNAQITRTAGNYPLEFYIENLNGVYVKYYLPCPDDDETTNWAKTIATTLDIEAITLKSLGLFYADELPETGTVGQICLVPVD